MQQSTSSDPKPGSPVPSASKSAALWIGLAALAAVTALGIAAPRFAGHARAHATSAGPQAAAAPSPRATKPASAATWDSTVPPASDVFVNPESGAVITPQSPTF